MQAIKTPVLADSYPLQPRITEGYEPFFTGLLGFCADATIDEALAVTNKDVVDALGGLPAHKLHCSVLAEEAVKSAVKDYYDKNGIAYDKKKFPECENCESCRMV